MHEIIDVPQDVGQFAERLAAAGVKTVIRYYNHRNGPVLPSKALTRRELDSLHGAGLSVAVIFEQRGGAGGNIGDLSAAAGARDSARALEMAGVMAQPNGSALYFAVDHDYFRQADLDQIEGYFRAVRTAVAGRFAIGVYGSGTVGRRLSNAGLVEHIWLAGAAAWSGTRQAREEGLFSLDQRHLEAISPVGGFAFDGNVANPAHPSFGQFGPGVVVETGRTAPGGALFRVTARSGLNLRSGPGEEFRIIQTLPNGALVTGRGATGPWMQIDLNGDAQTDGFMFAAFLQPVSGGLPIPTSQARRPIDVARAELAMNISEFPGPVNNPRIVLYHGTTTGGGAPDETPWCSSFVNYCVEQAGFIGTDSKAARSWHDTSWGREVAVASAAEGDVVVWSRVGGGQSGGHVGFFLSRDAAGITVLGGNQSNKVSIRSFPEAGILGPFKYTLLSVRRPA